MLAATVATPFATADASASSLPPTWHVHDCTATPCAPQHAPVGFFLSILDETLTTYLADPAACPDATDKMFLGGGQPNATNRDLNGNQPLREGVCMTSTTIIHLKSISTDQPAPDGWRLVTTSGGFTTYATLTSR